MDEIFNCLAFGISGTIASQHGVEVTYMPPAAVNAQLQAQEPAGLYMVEFGIADGPEAQ